MQHLHTGTTGCALSSSEVQQQKRGRQRVWSGSVYGAHLRTTDRVHRFLLWGTLLAQFELGCEVEAACRLFDALDWVPCTPASKNCVC